MQVLLERRLTDKLVHLPESGMGYQIVDLTLRSGARIQGITVLNGQIAEVPDDYPNLGPAEIADVELSKERH